MTQPIFRLVENTFYLEDNFESSEDYRPDSKENGNKQDIQENRSSTIWRNDSRV